MYKLSYKEDLSFNGFYKEGISKFIPSPNINISNELRHYLLSIGDFKLKLKPSKEILTIDDIEIFEIIINETENTPQEPTLYERVDALEIENAELLLNSVEQEIKVEIIEQDLADLMMEIATMRLEVE